MKWSPRSVVGWVLAVAVVLVVAVWSITNQRPSPDVSRETSVTTSSPTTTVYDPGADGCVLMWDLAGPIDTAGTLVWRWSTVCTTNLGLDDALRRGATIAEWPTNSVDLPPGDMNDPDWVDPSLIIGGPPPTVPENFDSGT